MQTGVLAAPSYEAALKVRLAARLRGLLRLSGLSLWALLSLTTFHPSHLLFGWLDLFTHHFIVKACWAVVAVLGLLPLLFWRKQKLAQGLTSPLPATNLSHVSRLSQKSFYATVLVYLASWTGLFLVWWQVAQFSSPEASLKVFVHNKIWQINPRFVYLLLVSLTTAVVAGMRHEIQNNSDVHFPAKATPDPIPVRAVSKMLEQVTRSTAPLLVVINFGFPVAWLLFRRPILKTLVYHTVFRPYFASLYRHVGISSSLILRSACLTGFLLISWDLLNVLFDAYMTQPILLSHFAPSPNKTLLQGLKLSNEHRQSLAVQELANLVLTNPERRRRIFKEVAVQGEESSLEALTKQCLQLLRDAQLLAQNRGEITVPAAAASAQPAAQRPSLPPVEMRSDSITRPLKPNFFDRLARTQSDSPGPSSPAGGSAAPPLPSTSGSPSPLPRVFQTPTSTPQKSSSSAPPSSASSQPSVRLAAPPLPMSRLAAALETLLVKAAPDRVRNSPMSRWLLKPLPAARIKRIVPHPEVSMWIVEALTSLMLASLKEDQYGIAQKSLTKVVESFVSHAQVLERVVKELGDGSDEEMQKALSSEVQPLLHTLQDGIRGILQAFKPFLSEFKWSPKVLETLRAYENCL